VVNDRAVEINGTTVLSLQIGIGLRGLEELVVILTSLLVSFARSRAITPIKGRGDRQDQEKTYTEGPISTHLLLEALVAIIFPTIKRLLRVILATPSALQRLVALRD
jgi:hypothetical protein